MTNVIDLAAANRLKQYYADLSYEQLLTVLSLEYEFGFPGRSSGCAMARLEHKLLLSTVRARAKTPFVGRFLAMIEEGATG